MGTHGLPNQPDTNRGQTLTESIDYSSKENIAGAAIDEPVRTGAAAKWMAPGNVDRAQVTSALLCHTPCDTAPTFDRCLHHTTSDSLGAGALDCEFQKWGTAQ